MFIRAANYKGSAGAGTHELVRTYYQACCVNENELPPVCLIFPAAIAAVWLLSSAAKAFISSFALNQLVV